MAKTKTSTFGTGKREGHDSSAYYKRKMHKGIFGEPLPDKELKKIVTSPPGDWSNQVYNQSSESMNQIPDNSIGLAFTSPPYNVGKDYDDDLQFEEYLTLIEKVGYEVYRTLKPGGRFVINLANLGRKPYIPLHSFFYQIHSDIGFLPMGEIIWIKGKGANGSCAWGSWLSAKSPRLRDLHEYLLVFSKMGYSRPDAGKSDISSSEFLESTISTWEIPPESAKKVGHPAPFPVELANRVIKLYSYLDDVILDPFLGSGTTCVAAKQNNRYYVGYDISEEYCRISNYRISQVISYQDNEDSNAVTED